jgi:hypothetical protein
MLADKHASYLQLVIRHVAQQPTSLPLANKAPVVATLLGPMRMPRIWMSLGCHFLFGGGEENFLKKKKKSKDQGNRIFAKLKDKANNSKDSHYNNKLSTFH